MHFSYSAVLPAGTCPFYVCKTVRQSLIKRHCIGFVYEKNRVVPPTRKTHSDVIAKKTLSASASQFAVASWRNEIGQSDPKLFCEVDVFAIGERFGRAIQSADSRWDEATQSRGFPTSVL